MDPRLNGGKAPRANGGRAGRWIDSGGGKGGGYAGSFPPYGFVLPPLIIP